ncbi:alpha/beta hydrolase family protein [Acinetobacter populi]|uniref:AB hydrolase-1 domain-containing protein n=1 Tax=Acinetobacter populi TaxID=1582270 RepID=A0A1Z9Z377_9GAMM|nr:alpha/beta fold hydrolase [Acinetobacter populi]OUY08882.1 hypothetical protein CAP51_04510 [Acinetobacter populi]
METIQVTTLDNIQLNGSYLKSELSTYKVVLVSPATGVKKHIYIKFAEFLNKHGFDVITWDWRGIADNLTGHVKDDMSIMEDWAKKDLNAIINWTSANLPDHKIFAVGHSFGGQAFGMAEDIQKVQSIVTVATQSGYWRHWPVKQRYQFAALWYAVMPILSHTIGFFPSKKLGLGENLPKGVALQWASWGRNPDYMGDYSGHKKMKQRILSFFFTDDSFAPKQAVEALHQHYSQCLIHYREISPQDLGVNTIGHFGFFKKDEAQKLWVEVIEFFNTN